MRYPMPLPHSMARSAQTNTSSIVTRVVWLTASLAGLLFAGGCNSSHHIAGLKPDYPALSCVGYRRTCPPFSNRTPLVDSLRPTFRWERFPRTADLAELGLTHAHERITSGLEELSTIDVAKPAPHAVERITAVRYELRLWKVGADFSGDVDHPTTSGQWIGEADEYKYVWGHECRDTDPGTLVYSKSELPSPEHTLETPLQPDSHYYWSIRAHFRLDGKRRATAWSEQLPLWYYGMEFPNRPCFPFATFHLFRTP